MAAVMLPIDPGAQARGAATPHLRHGDVAGQDSAGRIVITLSVDDWTLGSSDIGNSEDLEDADGVPEPDEEINGPRGSRFELHRPNGRDL